jgi:hypothetical protein
VVVENFPEDIINWDDEYHDPQCHSTAEEEQQLMEEMYYDYFSRECSETHGDYQQQYEANGEYGEEQHCHESYY